MKSLRAIMLAGTGSDVGKSVLAAGLCRILKQDGYRPAPFKAQNMALNSFATPEGLEIGRAQAVQAQACGIAPRVDMNPLLLKPGSDRTSQVVLLGKPTGNRDAYDYYREDGRGELRRTVCAAYDRLAADYSPIVLEGAGSISELNLIDTDLVNMPMAAYADAAVFLVADIDRGGVFASSYGSVALLCEEHRRLVKGIIINKFRGDAKLFDNGRSILERICGVPVLGLVPYFRDIYIEEEDSVALERKSCRVTKGLVNVAVVRTAHISNYTDFASPERDPRIHVFYTDNPYQVERADIVILPGSKSTIADLQQLRENGIAAAVKRAAHRGAVVLGICGGYQMMGMQVDDPQGIEGVPAAAPGLGLLPVYTTIGAEKCTRQVSFSAAPGIDFDFSGSGYEIHQGETIPDGEVYSPLCILADGTADGCFVSDYCMGTYLHGILDNKSFVDFLLRPFADRMVGKTSFDYAAFKEEQYDKLADLLRNHLDLEYIYALINRKV